MSVPTSVTPALPPRRSHGCLWGCLGIIVILCLPGAIAGWFFWQGYRHDPALQAAVELVRRDGIARQVLGRNIHMTGLAASASTFFGLSQENDAVIDLEGSLGQGTLEVRSHATQGGFKIDSLYLSGPDGRRYNLMKHGVPLPAPGTVDI